ncbi:MAG TPA: cytochrome c [Bryobacteraceae bacterium]|nr:cytochrome c [Bryobacteraceae bacterium]
MVRLLVAGLTTGLVLMAAPAPPVTFTKDIAPIFQEKCNECHRPGTVAPMALETYDQVRPWARSIRQRVLMRQMPPWSIDKSVGIQHFQNDRSLSEEQINAIVRWVDAGAPMGNPKDMPPAQQWPKDDGWLLAKQFGQPDFVLKSEPYTMPAQGQDQWWKPLADVPVTEPRWVRAVEIRPGTAIGRKITHHALAHLVQNDPDAAKLSSGDDAADAQGGVLMEWAVGKNYDIFREGTGKLLLPGSHIWWDIHYHSVGEEIRDHVELGVWLYPKGQEPKYRTYLTGFQATSTQGSPLDIPPNSIAVTQGYHVLKQAARLENFQPHMHLRGKAMLLEAILPDGATQTISYVGNFDFNWMTNYIYADDAAPVLPKGTIVKVTAWHDNTSANRGNPDPNQWVGWGDRTVDEMAHAWVNVTYISDEDYKAWAAQHKPARPAPADRRAQ